MLYLRLKFFVKKINRFEIVCVTSITYCRFSYAGNWELVKSIMKTNLEEAMFVYILKREIGYYS